MAEFDHIEGTDELSRLVEHARRAEPSPLDGGKQAQLVRAALRASRQPVLLAPRVTRYAVSLAAALLMGILGARAFEYTATRLTTTHLEVAPGADPRHLWLRTGDALVLARESAIEVLSETTARRELRLTRGAVLCDVKRLARGEGFQVVTPHARVEVRGTIFSVQLDDRHTTLQVHEGTVQVAGRTLHAGERWSSLSSASAVDHTLFADEVRAALAARGAASSHSAAPPRPEVVVPPEATSSAPTVLEARDSAAQHGSAEPPRAAPRRQTTPALVSPTAEVTAGPAPDVADRPTPEAAVQMLREGRSEQVLSLLAAHHTEPGYARIYADALRAVGDFDRAIVAYEALAERSRGAVHDQAAYAAAQLAQGPLRDPRRALRAIDGIDLTAPNQPLRERLSVLRIDALLALGRRSEAEAAAREYLAREPDTETSARLRQLLPR